MADGGSVTVQFKADTRDFEAGLKRVKQAASGSMTGSFASEVRARFAEMRRMESETKKLEKQLADAAEEAERFRAGLAKIGIAGLALNRVGANLAELGDKASAAGRAGAFLANITTGNLVGAIKAAGQASTLTSSDFQKFATDTTLSTTAVNEFALALERFGDTAAAEGVRAAAAMAATRGEIMQMKQAYKDAQSSFFSGLPSPTGKQGLAPFLGGKTPSFGKSTEFDRKFTGSLNKSLTQQLAEAGTTGSKGDNITALRSAITYLNRVKKDSRVKGDSRTNLYLTLGSLMDELASLTKKDKARKGAAGPLVPAGLEMSLADAQATEKTDDDIRVRTRIVKYLEKRIAVEKDQNRKVSMIRRLTDEREQIANLLKGKSKDTTQSLVNINPASLVGGLGQGSWLQGPMMQYAQSFGFKPRPQDFVRDLRQQVQSGLGFTKNIGKIGKAGGSKNLLGELASMGPQGQAIASALAGKPGLVKQYSGLADKRAAIAEKLQVQSMQVVASSVVVRAGSIVGVDRNGNGQLEKQERFTVTNGGIPRRSSGNPMHR